MLLQKVATTEVNLSLVVWVKVLLLGRSQRVKLDEHLSEEVRITSEVPQRSVLRPLLFLAYVYDIWMNTESNIWLCADDCTKCTKIMDSIVIDNLLTDLIIFGKLVVENEMKVNPGKSKVVSFTKARVKERIRYYIGNQSWRQIALNMKE
jgi:hypothetical protein